jgi:hypothetical protein
MDLTHEKQLAELEAVLNQQLAANEQLLGLLNSKRAALAAADQKRVVELCQHENIRVQLIGELEKRRMVLVAQLTLAVSPGAREPMRLSDLAERLAEPSRGRILLLRLRLRERMESVRRELGTAQRATEALVKHMQGLIQTISTAVTGIGTYNQVGRRPKAALAMSTFNTTA